MSKENLEQFMNQIAESEELQAKIGEEIDAEALIALGAECGCEFTAEELQESAELSDEEVLVYAERYHFNNTKVRHVPVNVEKEIGLVSKKKELKKRLNKLKKDLEKYA